MSTSTPRPPEIESVLERLRRAEKQQALIYRRMAAQAEMGENQQLAQRFHALHADEQHHLSRLTARVLELGGRPEELSHLEVKAVALNEWEETIRTRETAEIDRYREALKHDPDAQTRSLIQEILDTEERHLAELGGKWTLA